LSGSFTNEAHGELVLGRYRVMRRLAQGGMGVVYLGRLEGAAGFAKPVVIKRIISDPEDQAGSLARFVREAQILSNLQHPGIVGVLDFGEEAESYAMVLEYVHGYDLGRWLKYLQLKALVMPWEEAIFIALRVLEALGYAHGYQRADGSSAEIVHRDISPGNVLLDLDGRVRLADFGIARMAATTGDQYKTETGVLKGKIAYLAPELFSGLPPSPASDIYACAVVLYQMLAGQNPFTAHNDSRVMWRVIMEGPTPLGRQRDDLPPGLDQSLSVALCKDPARRHRSAEVFAEELRATLSRTEAEIGIGLRERLRTDFNGDMPTLLRLEPLVERDRAWRHDLPAAGPLLREAVLTTTPSLAPGATADTFTEQRVLRDTTLERAGGQAAVQGVALPAEPAHRPSRRSLRSLSYKPLIGLGLGMSVVIALIMVAALSYLQHPPAAPAASRFIVVEGGAPPEGTPVEPPRPAEAKLPTPVPASLSAELGAIERPGGERAATPKLRGKSPPADSSAALSRAFARRQRALGECFESHAAEVQGQPEVAIEFEVAASGRVTSADVVPRRLSNTPLGRCLLEVARATEFGSLGKTTRFSIPIRARAVRP
jgi:tRNA A-37 threonylcarbamoyl transferase component Bud32